jgi:isoleucyl-tRNA synthetase
LGQVVCVSSIEELATLSGVNNIADIHRESIDSITIPSKQGKGNLHRVDEVFDCWFESGRYALDLSSLPDFQKLIPFLLH